ncbi:MAG: ribonuclease Y [Patescibacteria group bacterium]|nr:ribonuclease Y [Patescibacteria group bacterium]
MSQNFTSIIVLASILIGAVIGYYFRKSVVSRLFDSLETKAREIEEKARRRAQEIILEAKEEQLAMIERVKKEEQLRKKDLKILEEKLEKRRALFDQKLLEFEEEKIKLAEKVKKVEEIKERVQALNDEANLRLEKISGLSKKEAKEMLFAQIEKEFQEEILNRIRKMEKEGAKEIEKKSQELLVLAMERYASSVAQERTTSTIGLPSEEMKGRIIGREGRNIKTLEQLTGVEIIIDDTPEVITISCFSPLRRELAKRTLERLILDGRIQPARIERIVEEVKKELAEEIKEIGEETAFKVGVVGLDPKLLQILGRLKYRTSYGQNVLQHSVEVANLSVLIASELGLDESVVKKAGLLHDIGKALDQETTGTHPEIGKKLGEKFGLPEEVIIPIATHHEDSPPTLEAIIVKVADAISGARPGARADSYEEYLKRLEDLEKTALSFPNVEKAYCLQAGREIRIFVNAQKIDDLEAGRLAKEIAKKIEADLKYPGEIKVTVIRETRITEYAR